MRQILAILLLSFINAQSQTLSERFKFKDKELEYSLAVKYISNSNLYIFTYYVFIISNNSAASLNSLKLTDCIQAGKQYYLLNITNENFTNEEKNQVIALFLKTITDKRKLVDSNLHLILSGNYSKLNFNEYLDTPLLIPKNLKVPKAITAICDYF